MKDKNIKILVVFSTLTLLVTMIGATFAYFTAVSTDKSSTPLEVYTYSQDLTSTTGTSVTLFVPQYKMRQEDGSNTYSQSHKGEEPSTLTIKTNVGSQGGTNTCVYDLVYIPYDITGPYPRSEKNVDNLKELVLEIKARPLDANTTITKGGFAEIDITDVYEELVLVKDATMVVEGVLASGEVIWEIYPKIYNLAVDQTANAGESFGGSVSVKNLSCDNE